MSDANKVCVVLGVGPGIGISVAKRFYAEGFRVAIAARNIDKLQQLSGSFSKSTAAEWLVKHAQVDRLKSFAVDVTDESSVQKLFSDVESAFGVDHVNTVVYNVGSGVWKTYDKLTMDEFDRCIKGNAHGLLATAQAACPKQVKACAAYARYKYTCNFAVTGATAAMRGKPFTAAFAPAKAAGRMLSESLARDLGPKGVHVYYVNIDGQVDGNHTGDEKYMSPDDIAQTYYDLSQQGKTTWTHYMDLRPSVENW